MKPYLGGREGGGDGGGERCEEGAERSEDAGRGVGGAAAAGAGDEAGGDARGEEGGAEGCEESESESAANGVTNSSTGSKMVRAAKDFSSEESSGGRSGLRDEGWCRWRSGRYPKGGKGHVPGMGRKGGDCAMVAKDSGSLSGQSQAARAGGARDRHRRAQTGMHDESRPRCEARELASAGSKEQREAKRVRWGAYECFVRNSIIGPAKKKEEERGRKTGLYASN